MNARIYWLRPPPTGVSTNARCAAPHVGPVHATTTPAGDAHVITRAALENACDRAFRLGWMIGSALAGGLLLLGMLAVKFAGGAP